MELPLHIDGWLVFTLTVGIESTVMVTVAESAQLPLEPTTLYVVVTVGVATGFEQVTQLNPVAGLQLKLAAPPAFRVTLPPVHNIGADGVTVTFSALETVITTDWVSLQEPVVPVTVYVVVTVGVAFTIAPVVTFNPVPGLQV